jgi:hypothetical protein
MTSFVGDELSACKLLLFCDAGFAGDLVDSKSTGGAILCLVGPNTFCPLTWICKKQGAVSHSSSEAEIIAMDAAMRLEGLPALCLWDLVLEVFPPTAAKQAQAQQKLETDTVELQSYESTLGETLPVEYQLLHDVDAVPGNTKVPKQRAELIIMEDNDAVIKMCIKGRSQNLRHVARTHRVDLDWLFERILKDPAISIKYVNTKQQIADIFTKGSFTEATWKVLCRLVQIWPTKGDKSEVAKTTELEKTQL